MNVSDCVCHFQKYKTLNWRKGHVVLKSDTRGANKYPSSTVPFNDKSFRKKPPKQTKNKTKTKQLSLWF